MLRSHVTRGFWLGLPSKFCKMYMPKEDCQITLVDDNEEQYVTNYIFSSHGLSGGWKGFSVAHGLVEGDTLIFHLVEAAKFKVTIIRGNALDNAKPLTPLKKINSRKHTNTVKRRGRPPKMRKLAAFQLPPKDLENCSAVDTSEVLEGIKLFRNPIKFENIITDQSNSSLIVNGMNLDSELSDDMRLKYHRLCCSQNACLHEKLIEGMNCKLVAGIISETVDIADAIETGNRRFSSNELDSLNKRLRAFEQMGMEVAFLRHQLRQAVVGTFKESKLMAKHSDLGQQKMADYESGKKGNSMKHEKFSGLGVVGTENGFRFRDRGTLACREPVAVESKHFHEDSMDDDFMKTWMY
ncbi:hypothetical protein Syun_015354 [Stephania yunnanensis]|uniref:TF-B3 domain-containing protein n=1 Tax=Stephania yunnanensis TaxID=152371 RepID=A0AAP0JLI5_9MAGN